MQEKCMQNFGQRRLKGRGLDVGGGEEEHIKVNLKIRYEDLD
jgi:hypothetical protein